MSCKERIGKWVSFEGCRLANTFTISNMKLYPRMRNGNSPIPLWKEIVVCCTFQGVNANLKWWLHTQAFWKGSTTDFDLEWEVILYLSCNKPYGMPEPWRLSQAWAQFCRQQHNNLFQKEIQSFMYLLMNRMEVLAPCLMEVLRPCEDHGPEHISKANNIQLHPVTKSKTPHIKI